MAPAGLSTSAQAWTAIFGDWRVVQEQIALQSGGVCGSSKSFTKDNDRCLHLQAAVGWSPATAVRNKCQAIFDGILYNTPELRRRFGAHLAQECTEADLVLSAYHAYGREALRQFRGIYALVIWDSAQDWLLCTRDQVGLHPLFYAESDRALVVSPSIESLAGRFGVSRELNRPGLVDHLARRWLNGEETYYKAVKRVPPCHVLQVDHGARGLIRYWDPAPPGQRIDVIPESEAQEKFDSAFAQAVGRCVAVGPLGINLSGGIDSSSVAVMATSICESLEKNKPQALSLVLPGDDVEEPWLQAGVAKALELPHFQIPFGDAVGIQGTLAASLDMSKTLSAPLLSVLRPALSRIMQEGRRLGCQAILTGDGADEWVAMNPHYARDLVQSLDVFGLYGLWRTFARSFPPTIETPFSRIAWGWGLRPWLRNLWYASPAKSLCNAILPGALERMRRRHMAKEKPAWLVTDSALGAEVELREADWWERVHRPDCGRDFCVQFSRSMIDRPQKLMFREETFALARRDGVRVVQPFWDTDLVEVMLKIHPRVRIRDGYTKSLMRGALIRKLPGLGFERRLKSYTGNVILGAITADMAKMYRKLGGAQMLSDLGVIDPDRASSFVEQAIVGNVHRDWLLVWELINLETWVRAHAS